VRSTYTKPLHVLTHAGMCVRAKHTHAQAHTRAHKHTHTLSLSSLSPSLSHTQAREKAKKLRESAGQDINESRRHQRQSHVAHEPTSGGGDDDDLL
jgi:hypothetical protein